jgi:mRNA interferase RelE/StbE
MEGCSGISNLLIGDMRRLIYRRRALRTLERIPANTSRLIRAKIRQYAEDPASLANSVKALQGHTGYFRLRVGDWRVVFREDGTVVDVIEIGPRGSVYE